MGNFDNLDPIVRPRIYSADKVPLENVIPLETPFSVHIDVCSVCNFKCSFCFQADENKKEAGFTLGLMDLDLFKKITDDLLEFPDKISKVKIGNHGEPTLHKLLPTFISYLREKDVCDTVEIFTNGSKLEPKLNRDLIDAGLQRINISLEGLTSERYLEIAGVKMDINELQKNMQDLYDYKSSIGSDLSIYIKVVDNTTPLNNDKQDSKLSEAFLFNDDERKYFFDTYGKMCDEIYIESIVPQWSQTQENNQNMDIINEDSIQRKGMYDQKIKKYKEICPFTFMYLHINWDGSTSPCTLDWPRKVLIGNAKNESAKEIWKGDKLADLQLAQLEGKRHNIDFCNDCSAPMVCCDEYLDPHAEGIREKMFPDLKKNTENQWVD